MTDGHERAADAPRPAVVETLYDEAWRAFETRFAFRPSTHRPEVPAIREPEDSLVLDLAPVFAAGPARFAAGVEAVEASARRVLLELAGDGPLLFLDWQHPARTYWPERVAALAGRRTHPGPAVPSPPSHPSLPSPPSHPSLPFLPVFPDGDYYVHAPADLGWGTFGHPWQQTLTLWGEELVATLGVELATWLAVRRRGGRPVG